MAFRPDIRAVLAARVRALAQAVEQLDLENEENLERTLIRLESVYVDLIEFDLCAGVSPSIISNVFEACHLLLETLEHGLEPTTCPGRPAFHIPPCCIENLMELGFTATEMAAILGVSRSTVCRRMRQYGISVSRNYCCITDDNLDEIVRSISLQHPRCGSKMMEGHLQAQGITVQQIQIRESLMRTDPEGTATRFYANM